MIFDQDLMEKLRKTWIQLSGLILTLLYLVHFHIIDGDDIDDNDDSIGTQEYACPYNRGYTFSPHIDVKSECTGQSVFM